MRFVSAVAAAAVAAALLSTVSCSSNDSNESAAPATTTTVKATTARSTTTTEKSATSTTSVSGSATTGAAATGAASASPTETWATNPLYVVNIPNEQFVKGVPNAEDAKINGKSYQYSWVWEPGWNENTTSEFNIPLGYKTLDFTLGMTDDSVVDKDTDGVASLTVYVGGNAVYGPTEFKYTDAIPVSIPIDGKSRIRIDVSGQNGDEYVALGSAKFTR